MSFAAHYCLGRPVVEYKFLSRYFLMSWVQFLTEQLDKAALHLVIRLLVGYFTEPFRDETTLHCTPMKLLDRPSQSFPETVTWGLKKKYNDCLTPPMYMFLPGTKWQHSACWTCALSESGPPNLSLPHASHENIAYHPKQPYCPPANHWDTIMTNCQHKSPPSQIYICSLLSYWIASIILSMHLKGASLADTQRE